MADLLQISIVANDPIELHDEPRAAGDDDTSQACRDITEDTDLRGRLVAESVGKPRPRFLTRVAQRTTKAPIESRRNTILHAITISASTQMVNNERHTSDCSSWVKNESK